MLRAGIIDSGISSSLLGLGADNYKGLSISKNTSGHLDIAEDDQEDYLLHGTVCAKIIQNYIPDITIVSVRIFEKVPYADEDVLVHAIHLCLEENVDVINISLGIQSTVISDKLIDACNNAFRRNVPIIAANHNDNKICYPAYYPKVFGVGNWQKSASVNFVYVTESPIDFFINGDYTAFGRAFSGSSFSCPKITGEVLKVLQKTGKVTISTLKNKLIAKGQRRSLPYPLLHKEYSYNEMTDFDYEKLLPIANKYLDRKSRFVNIKNILVWPLYDSSFEVLDNIKLNESNKECDIHLEENGFHQYHIPKPLSNKKQRANFDTVALGNLTSILSLDNKNELFAELSRLINEGKHFMVFDEITHVLLTSLKRSLKASNSIFYFPISHSVLNEFERFKYLPSIKTPIISVIGAGEKETISVQAYLYQLLKMEYAIEYIAPVAQGEVLGACFSFPSISTDMVHLNTQEKIKFIEYLVKAIQAFKMPDIIIAGTYGGLIPLGQKAASVYLDAGTYLLGLQPDALIMVVYYSDSYELIKSNLLVAQSYTHAQVLFLLFMDPCNRLSNLEKADLEKKARILYRDDLEVDLEIIASIKTFFTADSHVIK